MEVSGVLVRVLGNWVTTLTTHSAPEGCGDVCLCARVLTMFLFNSDTWFNVVNYNSSVYLGFCFFFK